LISKSVLVISAWVRLCQAADCHLIDAQFSENAFHAHVIGKLSRKGAIAWAASTLLE